MNGKLRNFATVPRSRARGFTFIELCLGLTVSALMVSAMAGFTLAVGAHWKSTDGTQSGSLSANQAIARIQRKLFNAKRLGFYRAGGGKNIAGLVYWRADDNADGLMQFTELAVLLHNETDKTIELYQPVLPNGATNDVWDNTAFTGITSIKKLTKNQTPTAIASRIAGASFLTTNATSSTMLPTFSFTLQVVQPDGSTSSEFGAATLRAAATPAP